MSDRKAEAKPRVNLMSGIVGLLISLVVAGSLVADDEVTRSPANTFRIVQHYAGDWDANLSFHDGLHADARLAREPDRYPWPAVYDISPDDQWIFRTQKTGSGESIAFLYQVGPQGRVWRMEQRLDELAFGFLDREHVSRKAYYHAGVEFLAWDLSQHRLRFRIHGSARQEGAQHLDRSFIYDLGSHTITE